MIQTTGSGHEAGGVPRKGASSLANAAVAVEKRHEDAEMDEGVLLPSRRRDRVAAGEHNDCGANSTRSSAKTDAS